MTAFQGAVHVYVLNSENNGWVQQASLTPSLSDDAKAFGEHFDLDGDTLVVGSYLQDYSNRTNAGAVFIFERNGTEWTETAVLWSPKPTAHNKFGRYVNVREHRIVVGIAGTAVEEIYTFVQCLDSTELPSGAGNPIHLTVSVGIVMLSLWIILGGA